MKSKAKTPKFKNTQLAREWERILNMELTSQDVRTDLIQDDEPLWLLDIVDSTFNYHEEADLDHDLTLVKKHAKIKYIPSVTERIQGCVRTATIYRDNATRTLKKTYAELTESVDKEPCGHASTLAWAIESLAKNACEMNYGNRLLIDLTDIAESEMSDVQKQEAVAALQIQLQKQLTDFSFCNSTSGGHNLVENQHKFNAIKLYHELLKIHLK